MRLLLIILFSFILFGCVQQPETPSQEPVSQQEPSEPLEETEAEGGAPQAGEEVTHVEEEIQPPEGEEPVPMLESEEINFYSVGWNIHGTLYPGVTDVPKKAVILLHMLGRERSTYDEHFIERIIEGIPDSVVLAIDMRGHGQSTNLGTWSSFDQSDFKDMKTDVTYAKSFLHDRYMTLEEYQVVGASIGSTAAISAGAQDRDITKVAMLSPGMEYQGVSIERPADEYQKMLLLVAASGDTYSYNSVYEIDGLSSSQKVIKIYSGSAHGTDLFDATVNDKEPLSDVLIDFLKR